MDRLGRTAIVISSGFENERQMVDAFVPLVDGLCAELLTNVSLNENMKRGIASARHDFPIGLKDLQDTIDRRSFSSPEERAHLMFVLAKTMDDLLSLGAAAGSNVTRDQFSFSSREGGKASGKTRRTKAEDWKKYAKTVIVDCNIAYPSYGPDALTRFAIDKGGVKKSESSVKALVRELIKDGSVAPKTKEKGQRTA